MGKNEITTININQDLQCSECESAGVVNDTGLCMKCAGKMVSDKIKADGEPVFYNSADQQFAVAYEAKLIGETLVRQFHRHLIDHRIEYVFLKNTPSSKGRDTWGKAKKISGLNAWLADEDRKDSSLPDAFFVIEISYDIWRALETGQKRALIDHELAHCSVNDDLKPTLKGHDCEEFNQVITRHGLWRESVKNLLEAAKEASENPLFAEHIG